MSLVDAPKLPLEIGDSTRQAKVKASITKELFIVLQSEKNRENEA